MRGKPARNTWPLRGIPAWTPGAMRGKPIRNPWPLSAKPAWRNARGIILFVNCLSLHLRPAGRNDVPTTGRYDRGGAVQKNDGQLLKPFDRAPRMPAQNGAWPEWETVRPNYVQWPPDSPPRGEGQQQWYNSGGRDQYDENADHGWGHYTPSASSNWWQCGPCGWSAR